MADQPLILPGRLDSTSLEGLLSALRERRGSDLDLDGSMVDRIGGQGLQLLISAFQTWSADGFRLRVIDPSFNLTTAVERLGFPAASLNGAQGQ